MEFRLLGPLEVQEDGRALPLGGRRQRAVLAHLLLPPSAVLSADLLIERVWGDEAPVAVRASLHTYVSRLRTTLGPSRIETRSQGYVLHATGDQVDAALYEERVARARALAATDPQAAGACYDEALALWRGPALGDLADEPSLAAAAAHLESLRTCAVEERIGVHLAAGRHQELLPQLEDLLRREPLREDVWVHYVLALFRCGRQADALAAFATVRRLLRDELGVAPSADLTRLHERVLRQDWTLTPHGAVLHGYRLLEVLAQGGSSVVHRAVQPTVGREVALKVLRPEVADDPRLVQRFATDAQAAAKVAHPHVVPLHDYWRGPGGAFLVLRLLRGGSLADALTRDPLSLDALVRLVDQVARALDACHRQGVVHHEVTSRQVLLDEDGNAYVTPFVLARELTRARRRAAGGDGPHPPPPGRPDVVALGRLLHELVGAVPAPPAAVLAVLEQALTRPDWPEAQGLAADLRAAVPSTAIVPRPAPRPGERLRNPYKGLRPFNESDAADFFGRGALVTRLVKRLAEPLRFLAVVGPSGCGKSSVVRAGLVPALRAGALPGVQRWYVADVVPGQDPLAELVAALRRVAVAPLPPDSVDRFRSDPHSLAVLGSGLLPADDDGQTSELLLLVDQLEGLFTLAAEPDASAFMGLLVRAATDPGSRVRVVVTLRADFYDRPLTRPALAELLRSGTEVVLPLSAQGLEEAVVEPADRVGLRVEPALLAQVVADVGAAPGALPLLQFALTELVQHTHDRALTLDCYREIGGIQGALVRRADGVYKGFTPRQQHVARQVLLALVQPEEGGRVVARRRVLQAELVQRTDDPDAAQGVIDSLGAARLLAFDRDRTNRAPTVEVAHEAMLHEWDLLRGWVDAAREDLRTAQRLTAAAREWEESGRDLSGLAAGARLTALEQWSLRWSAATGWTPTPLERAYLDESLRVHDEAEQREHDRWVHEQELERRDAHRLRAAALVLAIAVIAASALTAYGFSQRNLAERESLVAQARGLAAAAVASVDDDPERAVLLALEAVRRTRDDDGLVLPQAEEALHRAVVASRVVLTMAGVSGPVDWSARGVIASAGADGSGQIDLRDARSGASLRVFHGHDVDVNDVAFSPDGRRLLTTGDDGAARLWDPATGRKVWELVTRGAVRGPSFSGDSTMLTAAWHDEGVVRVMDAATGAVVSTIRSVGTPTATALDRTGQRVGVAARGVPGALLHEVRSGAQLLHVASDGPPALDVGISPDGRRLATSGVDGRARLWSVQDGRAIGTLYTSAPVSALDWSPDSSRAVVGGDDGVARVFAVSDDGIRQVLRLSASGLRGVAGAAFSPDGDRVLLGDASTGAAQVWDVSPAGSREWVTVTTPQQALQGADFTADGNAVVVGSPDGRVAVVDLRTGRTVRQSRPYDAAVALLRTSPDGALVAGFAAGATRVWSLADAGERFAVALGPALGLSWSGDGSVLAVTTQEGVLHLVDRAGVVQPAPPQAPGDRVTAAAFSADGRLLMTAHRTARSGAPRAAYVEVWDRSRSELVRRWTTGTDALAVGPDGRRVALAQPDGDIALWDTASGRQTGTLVGHVGPVWDLAFDADGDQLATSGQDATVRLWDLRSVSERLALRGHDSVVSSVRFSRDGRRLVTSSGDGTVRVWALALDDLLQLARDRLTRGLSPAECRRYLQKDC